MRNPWLAIPAADYEGHMGMDTVRQLQALAEVFATVLAEVRPRRLAVPGCTTGNGLEHVRPKVTDRVVGVDLNLEYLHLLRRRFAGRLPGLATVAADLRRPVLRPGAFDLVHCALTLEYLDPRTAVPAMASWLAPGGVLAVVLQLPSPRSGPVSATPYPSLQTLAPIMSLVKPAELDRLATGCGLGRERQWQVALPRGKVLHVALYRRNQPKT
jgi:SAM-dependent methyltransferase